MRFKATIAYDGTSYCGWQIQEGHLATIQSEVEKCLEKIGRTPVRVHGAGRTDAGVHAYGQVAHFDWENRLEPERLILGMNALLPLDIRVVSLEPADSRFHARFDATSKIYLYRIDRSRVYNPFTHRYALHLWIPLDLDLMFECASRICGRHDFSAFQATGTDVVSSIRTIFKVEVLPEVSESPHIPPLMCIRFQADGFLRKMVRFLVGTMLEIAGGRRSMEDLDAALETGDRSRAGIPAAARGLFLEKVFYDGDNVNEAVTETQ
jgi:tRNA pseudouridine38-40 synthase